MVGNEKSIRHQCPFYEGIHQFPKCRRFREEGVGFPECCHRTLEGKSRPHDADAKDQAAAKASAAAGLYDAIGSRPVPVACTADAALGAILPDWVVHWIEAECDHWPEVVNGES